MSGLMPVRATSPAVCAHVPVGPGKSGLLPSGTVAARRDASSSHGCVVADAAPCRSQSTSPRKDGTGGRPLLPLPLVSSRGIGRPDTAAVPALPELPGAPATPLPVVDDSGVGAGVDAADAARLLPAPRLWLIRAWFIRLEARCRKVAATLVLSAVVGEVNAPPLEAAGDGAASQ